MKRLEIGSIATVMLLWGISLGYPLQQLQQFRCTLFGHLVPIIYVAMVLLMLGGGALALISHREWMRWEVLWWLLPLICAPGILYSSSPVWSARQWFSWAIRGIIPGGTLFLAGGRERYRSMLLWWIYPVIIAAALLGLAESYYNYNPLWDKFILPIPEASQSNNPFYRPLPFSLTARPMGTQGNRIPYSATLIAFVPLGLWLLKYKTRFYWAQLVSVYMLFAILVLTYVRAVWISAFVLVPIMYVLGLRIKFRDSVRIIVGVCLCLALFLAWPKSYTLLYYRLHSFHSTERSIRERLDVLQTAHVLKTRWLVGVGFDQFPTACRPYYHGTQPWVGTPDNQYLRWAIENGVPSLLLLGAYLVGLIRTGWKKIRTMSDENADLYRSLLAGWLGLAVTFAFFDGFYWGACNMTFWCLLGLYATCLQSGE